MNCWEPLRAMTTTAYASNGDRDGAKSVMDWAISSQAAQRWVEGSTTSENREHASYCGFPQTCVKPMSRHECPTTKAEYQRQYRERNAEKLRQQKAEWYAKNRDTEQAKRRNDYAKNAQAYKARRAARYAEKRDAELQTNRRWVENNWEVRAAIYGRARANRLAGARAVPAFYDHTRAIALYAEAKRRTDETGVVHHVDHIVPLRSNDACGLHWHENLQVITASENCRKRSSLVEDIVWTAPKGVEAVDKEPLC
mgnify:CR=1 FL=1